MKVSEKLSSEEREAATRILGAADAYAHMLVRLKTQIGNIMSQRIDERHVRKLAARDRAIRPLVKLKEFCELHHHECQNAYRRRMNGEKF